MVTIPRYSLIRDQRGIVALYAALFAALILGMGVLSIDVGRVVVLRTQLQNAADAAATAAAAQLDGRAGARARDFRGDIGGTADHALQF